LIGSGVRVEGNVTFTGVLHIQGAVLGDVSCDVDSNGTIVVGDSGIVTGTIRAPHIVVSGRIYGPVHSSESIEIRQGACVVGDAFYKEIDIHAGGVIEGMLTPGVLMDGDRLKQEHRIEDSEPPAVNEYDIRSASAGAVGSGFGKRFGGGRKIGGVVILLFAVVAVVLLNREPTSSAPPLVDVAVKADSPATEASTAQSTPVGSVGLQDGPQAVAGDVIARVPGADADNKSGVQASSTDLPEMDMAEVVTVQGVNPAKPAGVFSVISRGPSVLTRKTRGDAAGGSRVDVPQAAAVTITIAKNEVFRVEKGRDLEIFYQGRKVAPKTIESGAWMSFVPSRVQSGR
jgi:cytoskeletal protein CcmA (bactofilin family)